jgi:hypothetical protein
MIAQSRFLGKREAACWLVQTGTYGDCLVTGRPPAVAAAHHCAEGRPAGGGSQVWKRSSIMLKAMHIRREAKARQEELHALALRVGNIQLKRWQWPGKPW